MKGSVHPLSFSTRHDPDTGARVTRLTPTNRVCHRNYFYQKCFTQDGQKLLFGGSFDIGGPWNYHLLDLQAQTARQLTDGVSENTFGGFLSPDDTQLLFVRGDRELLRVDIASGAEERIYTVPEGWVGYGTWVANSACTSLVGIEIDARDWFELDDWRKFAQMFHARPRCRLIRIELKSGARETVLEQQGWLGHPQYRPGDDNTIAYCHEGPHHLIDARIWFINADGSHRRCGKVHEAGESCTHEFWVPDGSSMVYVSFQRDGTGINDASEGGERRICSLDPVTLQSRVLMTMPPCSHLMSNHDGSLIVGDGAGADPCLHLFDLRAGSQRRIARHDSSWTVRYSNRQVTHPHPSFSPDNKTVLFTSDAEGEPALYLAELAA